MHLHLHFLGGRFNRRNQLQVILELFHRRHEGAEHAVADFDRHRGAHTAGSWLLFLHRLLRSARVRGALIVDRQFFARLQWILLDSIRVIVGGNIRQRRDRQPQAHRRIARHQEQVAAPKFPALAFPAPGVRVPALDRQHKPAWRVEPGIEHPRHACPLFRIGQFGVGRIDVRRQAGFLLQPVAGIFERRHDEF